MFEWDETVAYDEEAQYIGRICKQEDPNQVLLDKLPQHYEEYKELFLRATGRSEQRDGRSIMRSTSNQELNHPGDQSTRCQPINSIR